MIGYPFAHLFETQRKTKSLVQPYHKTDFTDCLVTTKTNNVSFLMMSFYIKNLLKQGDKILNYKYRLLKKIGQGS